MTVARPPEVDRAVEDLRAYIGTLSASEALWEIRDLAGFYQATVTIAELTGRPGAVQLAASLMTPILLNLARQVDVVVNPDGGGITSTPPPRDGIKARDLVVRLLEAS